MANWVWFLVGILVGANISLVVISLCIVARRGEDEWRNH